MQLIWKTSHPGLEMDISAQSTERGHKLQNICTAYRQLCQFSRKVKEQFAIDCPHIVFCYRHMYMCVLKMWLYFVVRDPLFHSFEENVCLKQSDLWSMKHKQMNSLYECEQ